MADMIYRQWLILKQLSQRPQTLADIEKVLRRENITCHRRTLDRDLNQLSEHFAITSDESSKPYTWFWMENAPRLEIPSMTPDMALTFVMAEKMLKNALPVEVVDLLSGYFDSARKILASVDNPFKYWSSKVATISTRLPMLAPQIDAASMKVVYDALLKEKRFVCDYQKADGEKREYEISPRGLIFADNVVYIVGTLWEYNDLRQFALHRIGNAKLLEQDISAQHADFNLPRYIADGHFFFKKEGKKPLKLKLKLDKDMLRILRETPISADQKISQVTEHDFILQASVPDNAQIKWWILSLGENVTVLQPKRFRQKIMTSIANMMQNYPDLNQA